MVYPTQNCFHNKRHTPEFFDLQWMFISEKYDRNNNKFSSERKITYSTLTKNMKDGEKDDQFTRLVEETLKVHDFIRASRLSQQHKLESWEQKKGEKEVTTQMAVRNSTKLERELVLEKGSTMRISTKRKGLRKTHERG